MSLIRRGIGSQSFRVRAVLIATALTFSIIFVLILNLSHSDSLTQGNSAHDSKKRSPDPKNSSPAKTKNDKKDSEAAKKSSSKTPPKAQVNPAAPAKFVINAKAGVYNGPGAVAAHASFENWLGKPVPYATDYIDYKDGWQKDFVDSKVWLIKPWSEWVKANSSRRLVLGLPMLENENAGQFDQAIVGNFDQYFLSLSNNLVSAGLGNSIIRLGYEANCDTIGPWQATNNPQGYRLLYRHIAAVMRSVAGNSYAFDWSVCNGLQNGRALNSFNSFYPGDDVVDIDGMDIYDVKWQDIKATPQQRWQYLASRSLGINEFVQFARIHGKAISYPEWGLYKPGDNFAGGGDNPYFINKMGELISSTSPLYQSYFNLDWGGGKLFDFATGKDTYRQIFGG
jgi:hypothetical protein